MKTPQILVTGKNGQVGWELARTLAPLGAVTAVDIDECDLTDPASIVQLIKEVSPNIIVNPAAYTAVDKAESEKDLAHAINATAPGIFASEAKKNNALMVHYSTDYVFDGTQDTPYVETDTPNPQSVYGATKLAGEDAVRTSGAKHLIFRLSWVYGLRGANFLLTMKRLAKEREELRVVSDQFGAPTWCRMIAEATASVLAQHIATPIEQSGTYHMTAGGKTSWHQFAESIFEMAPESAEFVLKNVVPITTAEYPTPARRPALSVLSNKLLHDTFGVTLPNWDAQLKLVSEL